ncbi:quinone oxidoreductase [Aquisalimonas lutea]|uniref:quinone oxidoreductase family protein n=1 Tax=Aquisalimonas lutea TaxID=1327750 RepID=UPI0025B59E99|nr:quinone oxidoreductase [Aquisalimonas lutea]MDN3517547.1 quinone oxidoreductase [Aquisalimonas lutea]
MHYAIRVHQPGEPDVLKWEPIRVGHPDAGEVFVRHTAIGCNFADVYYRSGLYATPLPFIPGREGVGVVEEVGDGVTHLVPGDRVGYASVSGSYCQARLIDADRLVKLPPSVDDHTAAASLLRGMTAKCLVRDVHSVSDSDTVLIQAAAGGVGVLVCQWASSLGATVIGTVSTDEKAAIARANGCHYPIVYSRDDFREAVREITCDQGVTVAYDSVGRETLSGSLACLRPRGILVLFGQSSGAPPPLDLAELARGGSLTVTRPMLPDFIASRRQLEATASELFDALDRRILRIEIGQSYPLEKAQQAHEALEARRTTGSTILTV